MNSTTITLGSFLRDRRARLQPDVKVARRRTPGLRREEVATRAGVSVTWYTCLEQGRGGPPSEDMLERLARALELDRDARELMFLLAQQRPPPVVPTAPAAVVPASVQRMLDALRMPAFVKTATWDVIAWNDALSIFGGYAHLPPSERNVLRRMFLTNAMREHVPDFEDHARAAVAIFRMDVARLGGSAEASALAAELLAASEDFRRLWAENDVRSSGIGGKRIAHPVVGELGVESTVLPVEGEAGLGIVVLTPATDADAAKFEQLLLAADAAHRD